MINHIDLLSNWYKAAVEKKPAIMPDNVIDIFNDDYYQQIRFLDFSKAINATPQITTWFKYTASELNSFKISFSRVVDKYEIYFGPDILELLESIANSSLINFSISAGNIDMKGIDIAHKYNHTYNIFYDKSMIGLVKSHIDNIVLLLKFIKQNVSNPITIKDLTFCADHIAPNWGSARLTENSRPFIKAGIGPPPS